jgi:hypothetical protein|tara:strand:- start:5324 stop:5458 length:135 start_codon:yes stop_codon:yes gene_type:complete
MMMTEKIAKMIRVAQQAQDPDFKRIWMNKINYLVRKSLERDGKK